MSLTTVRFETVKTGAFALVLHFDVDRLRGGRSVFGPCLYLHATPTIEGQQPMGAYELRFVQGTFSLAGEVDGLPIPLQTWLYGMQELVVPITDVQLAYLEQRRAGADIVGELRLWGAAARLQTSENAEKDIFDQVTSARSPVSYKIAREHWLKVREDCGAGKVRIIELPVPLLSGNKAWDGVAALLADSARELGMGRVGTSMIQTRKALEKLLDAIAEMLKCEPWKKSVRLPDRAKKIAEHFKKLDVPYTDGPYNLLSALLTTIVACSWFASPATHEEQRHVERDDAQLALSLTASMYAYLVRRPGCLVGREAPSDVDVEKDLS